LFSLRFSRPFFRLREIPFVERDACSTSNTYGVPTESDAAWRTEMIVKKLFAYQSKWQLLNCSSDLLGSKAAPNQRD
jgi:hypothetical protein